jgi:hypothetical protein
MKQFKTDYNGLLPILLDDIRFVQEAYDEQILAFLKPWVLATDNNSLILYGVERIGSSYNYTEGWVIINGLMYRAPQCTISFPESGFKWVWHIQDVTLAGGTKTTKRTLVDVETRIEHIAVPVLAFEEVTSYVDFNLPRLNVTSIDTGWLELEIQDGWNYGSLDNPMYRLKNGVVYLKGALQPNGSTTGTIAILPDNINPNTPLIFTDVMYIEIVEDVAYLKGNSLYYHTLAIVSYPL